MIDGRSSQIANDETLPVITDAELQDLWPNFSTDLSAKELCDIWITYQGTTDTSDPPITGVPAVEYTRSLTIPGITGSFDVPNIYELMVMFLEQEAIDNLDKYKSVSEYQNYLLAYNSNNNRWFNNNLVWSASEGTAFGVWSVRYYCYASVYPKDIDPLGVTPVQELSF